MTRFEKRFFESTRGQIVMLLRRARRTVDELASALGLTDNAVRAHLTTLERDGLVQQQGVRKGEGKPAQVYALTSEAEELFPKAHPPVLNELLTLLQERLSSSDLTSALREVGRRMGQEHHVRAGNPRARLEGAAAVLASLGGLAEVETGEAGVLRMVGVSCPLGSMVVEHPEACLLAESLVSEATGLRVVERCVRDTGRAPRCCFEVQGIDS